MLLSHDCEIENDPQLRTLAMIRPAHHLDATTRERAFSGRDDGQFFALFPLVAQAPRSRDQTVICRLSSTHYSSARSSRSVQQNRFGIARTTGRNRRELLGVFCSVQCRLLGPGKLRIAFALLADYALAHPTDGKLYVSGGGIRSLTFSAFPATYPRLALALGIEASERRGGHRAPPANPCA